MRSVSNWNTVNIAKIKGYVPGVLGPMAKLHGEYYNKYWGFGLYFEARVASELAELLQRYDENRDGFWLTRRNGSVRGSIAVDGFNAKDDGARLRWFIVSEDLTGAGTGYDLLVTAIEHCQLRAYPRIYLDTFKGLAAARHLYEKNGFTLAGRAIGTQWGREVEDQ